MYDGTLDGPPPQAGFPVVPHETQGELLCPIRQGGAVQPCTFGRLTAKQDSPQARRLTAPSFPHSADRQKDAERDAD